MMLLYTRFAKAYGWSLNDIDETDFETLIDFVWFREDDDPNIRVIDGKEYKRAEDVPSWL